MYNNKSAVIRIEDDTLERDRDFQEFFTEYDVPEDSDVYIEYDSDVIDEMEEPYSYFLKKNGYDKLTNTIVVEGERVDAGEINFRETRDRLNSYLREHNFDQDTDTFVVESADGESSEVKVMSLDSIYPDEVLSDDMSLEEYYESYIKMGELIEESFDGYIFQEDAKNLVRKVVKGGIYTIKTLIDTLWKAITFLFRLIGRFIKFIAGLFKKKSTSADQVLWNMTGDVLKPNKNVKSGKEHITGAPGSEITSDTVDIIVRDFDIFVNNDNSSIKIKYINSFPELGIDVTNTDDKNYKHAYLFGDIKGPLTAGIGKFTIAAILLSGKEIDGISFDELMDRFKSVIADVNSELENVNGDYRNDDPILSKIVNELDDLRSKLMKIYEHTSDKIIESFEFKYKDVLRVQKKLNDIIPVVDKLRYVDLDKINSGVAKNNFSVIINDITTLFNIMVFSINKVSNEMSSLWVVNGRYKNQCNDISVLSKITDGFIKTGIPSKFVRHNLMILLSKDLNTSSPKMGQSRCVFFPKDKRIVLKAATNAVGIQGNISEYNITQALKRLGVHDLVAPIVQKWSDSVVAQEKCSTLGYLEAQHAKSKVEETLETIQKNHPSFKFGIDDVHEENVGKSPSGNYVIIDYGSWTKTR